MKKIAYIGCIGLLGIITTEFGIIGILPQIAAHYHISIDKAGTLLSAFSLVIAFTGPFMTLLASKYDRKNVLMTAMGIFVISNVVSVFAPPFWGLMIARVIPAFLQPVFIATALSVAVAAADDARKNEMMSIVFSGIAIAMVTTVPLAAYLASKFTFACSYYVGGVVTIVSLALLYWGMPVMPVTVPQSFGSQAQILRKPTFIISTLMNFFMIAAWFSTYSYIADYLNKAKAMDNVTVSYMLFVFGFVGVVASFVAGKMLNKNITGTTLFFLSGTILIPLLLQYAGGYTVLVIAIWGFMYSPSFLNASTYMISSAPEAMAFANSLATSFGNLGVTLGTTLGGWMIATKGVEYTPWLTMGLGILAIAMIGLRVVVEKRLAVTPACC